MARQVQSPSRSVSPTANTRSLLGTVRSGGSFLRQINQAPGGTPFLSPGTDQSLAQGLGGLDIGLGGLGVYDAATSPYLTDAQKGLRAARGGLQAAQGVGTLTGAYNVPALDYATTALSIGDIATNPAMNDAEKAYESLHQAAKLVANIYAPGVGGIGADVVKLARDNLFGLGPNSGDYLRTRDREAGSLPTDANYSLLRILQASSPAELQAAVSEPTYLGPGRPVQQNGRIGFTGTHLPGLGSLEDALTNAYQRQSGLFSAADAGDPQALGILGQLQAAGQRRSSDLGTLASVFHNQRIPGMTEYLANPGALRAASTMLPDALRDLIGDWASSEALTAEITGSQAQTHPLIGSILAAGAGLGIDPMESLLAARDRAIQASQPYDTQGEAGVVSGRAFDPRGFDALLGTQTILPVPMDQGEGGTVWVDPRTGQAVPGLGGGGRFQEQNLP